MAEAVLFGIAEEVLKNLGSRALDEIASAWGFKARLEQLKNTIYTIKDVLLDAEDRQADSHTVHGCLERLTTAVYAADDLFDEVATVASRQQLRGRNSISNKVQKFFSCSNQTVYAFQISRKIKAVRQELDSIVKDGTQFNFVHRSHEEERVIARKRDQTFSYVDAKDVIGRDDEKKFILDMLFSSCFTGDDDQVQEEEVLPVISIVGIGGQGKTTLAQLIYNDPQIKKHFELRLWVCVSDNFDIKGITEKLLMSATDAETQKVEMEQLQGKWRKEVNDKKYFLVLDDVWNEDREEWIKLRALLNTGRQGSRILVTTRSMEVAKIMCSLPPYHLQGLSEEKAWDLFELVAFAPGEVQKKLNLVKVGKEIVRKCANVPLAIRALGSLLYGKDESKWLSIKDTSLANISESQNNISVMSILKLSYHHLWSPLKNCFAYCSLFPKDSRLKKEALIDLWMAEGFIIPTNESQSLEELAEEYFLVLLQRCFFQEVTRNEWGEITSCKMHDLMHDLAQQVGGNKCMVTKFGESDYNKRIHHLSFAYRLTSEWKIPSWMLNLKLLRTFLLPKQLGDGSAIHKSTCQELISRFKCLRVLDLHHLGVTRLPSSIGQLVHLRYLNLSVTLIKDLPDSITKLHNLQTLILYLCLKLTTLPTNIKELANLRSLDVDECHSLIHMPPGLEELTSLHKLPRFMVGNKYSPKFSSKPSAKLSDLKNLENLRGALHIEIHKDSTDLVSDLTKEILSSKHRLSDLHIELYGDVSDHDKAVMECLRPHPNLKKLRIDGYRGQKLPSWVMIEDLCRSLPNLVEISLNRCERCEQIPSFRQLPFLKRLTLEYLSSVEYLENDICDLSSSSSLPTTESLFFPSLQELKLMCLPTLKGWWKVRAIINSDTKEATNKLEQELSLMSFSNLSKLWIEGCPNLMSMPLSPDVEELRIVDTNKTLPVFKMVASSPESSSKLKKLSLGNIEDLISLTKECLPRLSLLEIQDTNLVSTSKLGEVFTNLSSLRSLAFCDCHKLRSLSRGLEHLTALEKLDLLNCEELDLSPNEAPGDEDDMPWKALKSLGYLQLREIPKLSAFPRGLQHLTNLHSLEIRFINDLKELPEWISCLQSLEYMELFGCPKLTSLPESFRKLTTLSQLWIIECPGLTERCRGPNGRDWSKIQHIPLVIVRESIFD